MRSDWVYHFDTLDDANPRMILQQFRADLYRAQAAVNRKRLKKGLETLSKSGWLFCAIHGEFGPKANAYPLHCHGLATEEWVEVLNALRLQRAYRPWKARGDVPGAKRPVQIRPLQFPDFADPVTYVIKVYWPEKWVGRVSDNHGIRRTRRHKRIREPFASQVLVWLDRWTLTDLTMMIGLSVCDGKLETRQ